MNHRIFAIAALVCASFATALPGETMAEMTIFSAVHGQVTSGGQPVSGAVVERSWRWRWKSENGADVVTTGADGVFAFPAVVRSSFFGGLLPHEPFVEQTILIKHGGQTYKAWMLDKRNYESNGELGGKAIRLSCRFEAPFQRHGHVSGICELL